MNKPSLIVYPGGDLEKSKALFKELLGAEPYADAPYYVGYRAGDLEIGLDPRGAERGSTEALAYWDVDDIHAGVQKLTAAGAELLQDVRAVGGGISIAILKTPGGAQFGLRTKSS